MHRPRGNEERGHLPELADTFELYDPEGNPIPVPDEPLSQAVRGEPFRELKVHIHNQWTGRERRLT